MLPVIRDAVQKGSDSVTMPVPHVLKDGADSVGVVGATLRVYINIGSYSQHFLQQQNVLIGLTKQKPFEIATAQKYSVYWLATQQKFQNVGKFFTRLKSYRLDDAPGGENLTPQDEAGANTAKKILAVDFPTGHPSKRPPPRAGARPRLTTPALQPRFER